MTRPICVTVLFILGSINAVFAQILLSVPNGRYEIETRVVLPHIDDNHTNTRTKRIRYLDEIDLTDLFPILSHPSFNHCQLIPVQPEVNNLNLYALKCDNPDAASGQARVVIYPNSFSAILDIKMGAKNMTMSEQVIAQKIVNIQ